MARTPDQTLQAFFDVFTSGATDATKIANLMNLFSQNGNDPQGHLAIPGVGISLHSANFVGVMAVEDLWTHFLGGSFKNFMFAPANISLQPGLIAPPRLYSKADYPTHAAPIPMIGIPCELRGDYFAKWFQNPPHNSNPLSGAPVPPAPIPVSLEACAVFAFDTTADSHITNLLVYLDRYKLGHAVNPGMSEILNGFNRALVKRQEVFDQLKNYP